jgi:hypothetical protein
MYHTSDKNIQILAKPNFIIFQIFQGIQIRYNKTMGILDNLENAWDENFEFESSNHKPEYPNLAVKMFSDICCNGCSCKTSNAHKPEN